MAIAGLQEWWHRYVSKRAKVWNQGRLLLLRPQAMQGWLESSSGRNLEPACSQGQDGLQASREQVPTEQESSNHDAGANGQALSNAVTDSDNTRQFHGFLYQLWDAQKIQGCKCDLGYSGPDCASRVAPKGDDPLTTVKSAMGVQAIQLSAQTGAFSIIYHDPYGGVWRTDGISSNSDDAIVAKSVQDALRALPNEVLEGVSVAKRTSAQTVCHRLKDGQQHIPSANGHGTTNKCGSTGSIGVDAAKQDFDVTFADKPGQTGVQFLLEVDVSARTAAGSFPTHAGISSGTYTIGEVIGSTDSALGALSELAECSDRGLDNGDGECECFDGFRGLACEEQEALV